VGREQVPLVGTVTFQFPTGWRIWFYIMIVWNLGFGLYDMHRGLYIWAGVFGANILYNIWCLSTHDESGPKGGKTIKITLPTFGRKAVKA
jgi:hypothetical protein